MKDRICLLSRKAPVLGVMLAAALLAFGPLAVECPAETGFGASITPTVPLSTQEPVAPLPTAPECVYPVDGFALGQDVWVAVPSVANGHDLSGSTARVYIMPHRAPEDWTTGSRLLDISAGYEMITIQPGKPFENYLMIWTNPQRVATYDIVVDFEPYGTFQRATDLVDHGGKTGIPGFAILGAGSVDYLMITPDTGFMGKVCTRIFGVGPYPGGLPEGVEYFVAYGWNNGPNGNPESGGGDDIALGPVSADWSINLAEDVARINELNGVYITGEHTGDGDVMATYPGATSDSVPINTTAPTWVRD
jgi:hypothetical protein